MGVRNLSLLLISGSQDQHGCNAHIWLNKLQKFIRSRKAYDLETCYVALGSWAHHSLYK